MIEIRRFEEILSRFTQVKLAVLGDFFLDLYIHLDRSLSELSMETQKEAFQAIGLRGQPGAAGVVVNNLSALGAQTSAIGYTGKDGNGYTLRSALTKSNINTDFLIEWDGRFTPTYTKPMMKELNGQIIELNRIDVINRSSNPQALNLALVENLSKAILNYDGILVLEQVKIDGYGTLSPILRDKLSELGRLSPDKVIIVDSRPFSNKYTDLSLKMNLFEAICAAKSLDKTLDDIDKNDKLRASARCSQIFWETHQKPIFITLGADGISGTSDGEFFHIPGYRNTGPIDIVGAGDAVLATVGLAQCVGADPKEAAFIGNLVGSLIVQQIGMTGTVTQDQLRQRYFEYQNQLENRK
ncbi:MAG: PfkB family carbohydrate kinase [Chloroflexota bacterium]|nr:PfkB family carbohydrate kinase [Chloroflexota bacterium]